MHPIIERLEEDHKRIICLMFSLRQELDKLSGMNPSQCDLDEVFRILDYIQTVPEQWHHPIESIVYDYYLEYIDTECALASGLKQQHIKLELLSERLLEHLSQKKIQSENFSATTIQLFTQYQSEQLSHINKERELFKLIDSNMSPENWIAVEDSINERKLESNSDDKYFSLDHYRSMGNLISKTPLVTERLSPSER